MRFSIVMLALFCLPCVAGYADTASQAEQGRKLYLSYGCAACHGKNADGKGIAVQGNPTDLRDPKAYHHGRDRSKIMFSIKYGIKDGQNVIPSFDYLPHEEVKLIAVYLESLMAEEPEDHSSNNDILVSGAWIRWMPPSRPNSAAYMTIENKTQKDIVLESVTSKEIERIEMHKMERVDGKMTMRLAEEIRVPSSGRTELKPGALHFMLFGIQKPLEKGAAIPITLKFQDGTSVEVSAIIKEDVQ